MDPNWSKEDKASHLAQQLNIQKDELTKERFIKKDGKFLNTVEADFTTKKVQQRAIPTELFIAN